MYQVCGMAINYVASGPLFVSFTVKIRPFDMNETFIDKVTKIIETHITEEQFGVSELADAVGMSRSNLLRRIKSASGKSVSQFIREVRLKEGMELLKEEVYTVSEVSYKVGFSSSSYFVKCFHDHYGYPPGEVNKRVILSPAEEVVSPEDLPTLLKKNGSWIKIAGVVLFLVLSAVIIYVLGPWSSGRKILDKSIAVLPFKNDSHDSTNIYIVNGLMESILNNLQQIEDARVISRTSVEKYRQRPKLVKDIAKELDVNYVVEGSGQKLGNQIFLNVQLIEANTDRHLWAGQYEREATGIFELQQEIAKIIADKIEVIITPQEQKQIEKIPTKNLEAYDHFLKGLDFMNQRNVPALDSALVYYEKAIDLDEDFARAHAGMAISYFFLDALHVEKKYVAQINTFADKALVLDPELPQALIAKALYYINNWEPQEALYYLEKALEYNPNSALVLNILADFYVRYVPNTEKYLQYALKGIQLDIGANDSATTSLIFLHLANALIQNGFVDEAHHYIQRSLQYDVNNHYSQYVKAFIEYARDRDLNTTVDQLLQVYQQDTTRLDVLQEVGKIYYYLRDFESSYVYYKRFIDARNALSLDIYRSEDAKIAVVFSKLGYEAASKELLKDFQEYVSYDQSIYKHMSQAVYWAVTGVPERALEEMALFTEEDHYHYWTIIFLGIDPLVDSIKDDPQFKRLYIKIEAKFWENHDRINKVLSKQRLLPEM